MATDHTEIDRSFAALLARCRSEALRGAPRGVSLQLVCDACADAVPRFRWFGFYIAAPAAGSFVLGPYQGARAPQTIRIRESHVSAGPDGSRTSDDAGLEPWVLDSPCVSRDENETAVPVLRESRTVGLLVVSLSRASSFLLADRWFLREVAALAAPFVPDI